MSATSVASVAAGVPARRLCVTPARVAARPGGLWLFDPRSISKARARALLCPWAPIPRRSLRLGGAEAGLYAIGVNLSYDFRFWVAIFGSGIYVFSGFSGHCTTGESRLIESGIRLRSGFIPDLFSQHVGRKARPAKEAAPIAVGYEIRSVNAFGALRPDGPTKSRRKSTPAVSNNTSRRACPYAFPLGFGNAPPMSLCRGRRSVPHVAVNVRSF